MSSFTFSSFPFGDFLFHIIHNPDVVTMRYVVCGKVFIESGRLDDFCATALGFDDRAVKISFYQRNSTGCFQHTGSSVTFIRSKNVDYTYSLNAYHKGTEASGVLCGHDVCNFMCKVVDVVTQGLERHTARARTLLF